MYSRNFKTSILEILRQIKREQKDTYVPLFYFLIRRYHEHN